MKLDGNREVLKSFNYRIKDRVARVLCKQERIRPQLITALLKNHRTEVSEKLLLDHRTELIEKLLLDHRTELIEKLLLDHRTELIEKLLKNYGYKGLSLPLADKLDAMLLTWCTVTGRAIHFSQEGEDILLDRVLGCRDPGFFVDVGAHHPTRFSNTYSLYLKGWRGLNIDATPGSMEVFEQKRPEDINIECAVGEKTRPMQFHLFAESALNTFDQALAARYTAGGSKLIEIIEVVPRRLSAILDEYWPQHRSITLMTVDVEGSEMEVLRSNDWMAHRPEYIALEVLDTSLDSLATHPLVQFLAQYGYTPKSKLLQSVIFEREA